MEFKTKIIISIAFIIAIPIWQKLGELNDNRFVKRINKINPKLGSKISRFFSKEKSSISKYVTLIYIILFLLAIWVDLE